MRKRRFDVLVVGAGPAGLGVSILLQQYLGIRNFSVVDRYGVGASFARWPKEMRLITPSFPGNGFGAFDLNSIAVGTSPAHSLQCEHPSGVEYAAYLRAVAEHFELPVETGVEVFGVEPDAGDSLLHIHTSLGPRTTRFVVWAAGEFQSPRTSSFPGAESCTHVGQVGSWKDVAKDQALVIGGAESGIDAAVNLARLGASVRVLDPHFTLEDEASDPSVVLSPYTRRRLVAAQRRGSIELIETPQVVEVRTSHERYEILGADGSRFRTGTPPILANGFETSARLLQPHFAWRDDGCPVLSADDESTVVPGLFLAGPGVRHDHHVFCFIYKFRQRFAVVARAIGSRLGIDVEPLEALRAEGMFLDDLSCCGSECVC